MKKISNTSTIGDLLNTTIFGEFIKENRLDLIIKQSTIFSFWSDIVGMKFLKFTKPYAIKASKLFVAVKSPVVGQELTLNKKIILKKINSYSKPLNIEIKDIVFNFKNFVDKTQDNKENLIEDKPVFIKKEELDKIDVDKNIQQEIEKHINKINFLNDGQKEKFKNKIISTYKAKAIQNNK